MRLAVFGLAAVALTTTATVLIPPPTPGLNCALCLDDLDSQTGCGKRPNKTHWDPECLCSPENAWLAKGCNNACKGISFAKDLTCIWDNPAAKQQDTIAARGPYVGCAVCLQDAELNLGCAGDPADPNFNFGCLCQEPGFSTKVKGCNLFCADTPLNLDVQCPKAAPFAQRDLTDDDPRSCVLCLELASAQTSCKPSVDGFDFKCLCEADKSEWVSGCTDFCANTPNDLHAHCRAPYQTIAPGFPLTAAITPRGTIGNPKQTVDPHFGFCGPKGTNCKTTVRAPPAAEKYHHGYNLGNSVFDNNPYGPPPPTGAPIPKNSVPHRGNPSTLPLASGRFGFCGPSGINCRLEDTKPSAQAEAMMMVRENLTTTMGLNGSFTTTAQAVPGPSGVGNVTTTTIADAPTITHTHITTDAQDSMQIATPTQTASVQQGSAVLVIGKSVAEILLGAVAVAFLV
ncbi:hypothetical protein CKM354_000151100 [Cercospora kikuchii]|uniref:Extracellular membrane protein CFEM domain-containing protein n=1 Tax=Cercospora kikuchii TaxID=84275 RepID=A0A9P3FD14_9PEZI|nr:uncharacterized protein CKM354_000151100 [Cercospora kikuchii]GIZ38085.1 hypothetical protein CKM354_000151100 [Cercospora kikuchii]